METYSYTKEGLEELLDTAKAVVLRDLVLNNIINAKAAELYAGKTMLTTAKKTFFRTISNLWAKEAEADGFYIIAVHNDQIDVTDLETEEVTVKDKQNKILKLIRSDDTKKE